jgi:PAS domain-containing protein
MTAKAATDGSLINALFYDEPAGTFAHGHVFRSPPDLSSPQQDPDNGYWHYDIADHSLTWSEKVYELFGLPPGAAIGREWAVSRYSEDSRNALERVRTFGLNRNFGFILDAEIRPEGAAERWIRVLAVPILKERRVLGLHGLKRAL